MIKLYSTNCPKCLILETEINKKGIECCINSDVDKMLDLGIMSAPALELEDGTILNFKEALDYVRSM